jgi:hypothetical protein
MKKLLALLVLMLMPVVARAENVSMMGGYTYLVQNLTMNATLNQNTSGVPILMNGKTGFFVALNTGLANQTANMTIKISQDNSTWLTSNMTFFDAVVPVAGNQTLETVAANTSYYCWLPDMAPVPYVRMNIISVNTTDLKPSYVDVYVVGEVRQKGN